MVSLVRLPGAQVSDATPSQSAKVDKATFDKLVAGMGEADAEQLLGRTDPRGRCSQIDRDAPQGLIAFEEQDVFAVSRPPPSLQDTAGRDLQLRPGWSERLHEYVETSGLIGEETDPTTGRRFLGADFDTRSFDKWLRGAGT